ncbi:MAG: sugar phosphate isomerase/epimerase [Phycisphaerales bacterium]|nr:sugar phosphate isomerase/epimerase [Phycisphaerales bacterium]
MDTINRRSFLGYSAGIAAGISTGVLSSAAKGHSKASHSATTAHAQTRIRKGLKFGMISSGSTVLEKFTIAKEAGFEGVEMDAPSSWDLDEVLKAKEESGIEIPGVVLSSHWSSPFNHPDQKIRTTASNALERAIKDCKALGGTSVLVVPAVVNASMDYQHAYDQSKIEISRHVPLAESLGISIAFENVWNNFLLSPIEAARYVDEFESDHVGWYFDIGNIVNYGYPDQWIRTLGHRILKLDVKDFSRSKRNDEGLWKGFSVGIGEGDSDWDAVCEALREIMFSGWATAEVGGGDEARLKQIATRMDRVFEPLNT